MKESFAGKSQNSFIPYDVKRELFAHIQRERRHLYLSFIIYCNVLKKHLLYNTESEGLDAGEKSGLSPVRSRKQAKHTLTHEIYNAVLPETAYNANGY
jgi:hypothetical protein